MPVFYSFADIRAAADCREIATTLYGCKITNGRTAARWRNGDDPEREGMAKTPERVKKAWEFLTQGYRLTPADAIGDALFEERHHNMVLVKDNHIKIAGSITNAVALLRARAQHTFKFEVECESLEMVQEALDCGVEVIMFDNMDLDEMRAAAQAEIPSATVILIEVPRPAPVLVLESA
jgi:hypothetical protein